MDFKKITFSPGPLSDSDLCGFERNPTIEISNE
jgi:hypothetical protein